MTNKTRTRPVISAMLGVVTVVIFIVYFLQNRQDFQMLADIKPQFLVAAVLGHTLTIYTNGLLIKWFIEPYDKRISNYQGYYASLLSSIGNFFLPAGSGIALRAVYLKKIVSLNLKDFATTFYGGYIVLFLCYGFAGLLSVFVLGHKTANIPYYTLLLIFLGMFLTSLYLLFFGMPRFITGFFEPKSRYGKIISNVLLGWNKIIQHKKLMQKIVIVTVGWFVTSVFVNYSAARSVNLNIGVWQLVLLSAMSSVAMLINITPGSIGIREGLLIYASGLLSLSTPQIISLSIIERSTKFLVLIGGWLIEQARKIIMHEK